MHSRTLAQLRSEVRYLGDAEGLTARHPDSDLNRRLNQGVRAYRALVTASGLPYFITQTASTTLTGTTVSGETYSQIPFPTGAEQILGVDVASATGVDDWYPLQPITWQARRNARWGNSGRPQYFAIKTVPQANPADLDAVLEGTIAVFPACESGVYTVSYIPSYVDMAADADLLVALPDACDWVVWHVVCDLAARDDDQRETYQIATMKKAECEARILASIGKVQSAGPLLPRRRGRRFAR
jgi:hypothetical protein